jgi:hypothetical protein
MPDTSRWRHLQIAQQNLEKARMIVESSSACAADLAVAKATVASNIKDLLSRDGRFASLYAKTASSRIVLDDIIDDATLRIHSPASTSKQTAKQANDQDPKLVNQVTMPSPSPAALRTNRFQLNPLAKDIATIKATGRTDDDRSSQRQNSVTVSPQKMATKSHELHSGKQRITGQIDSKVSASATDCVIASSGTLEKKPTDSTGQMDETDTAADVEMVDDYSPDYKHSLAVCVQTTEDIGQGPAHVMRNALLPKACDNTIAGQPSTAVTPRPSQTPLTPSPALTKRGNELFFSTPDKIRSSRTPIDTIERQETPSKSSVPQSTHIFTSQQVSPLASQIYQSRRRMIELEREANFRQLRDVHFELELRKLDEGEDISSGTAMEHDMSDM